MTTPLADDVREELTKAINAALTPLGPRCRGVILVTVWEEDEKTYGAPYSIHASLGAPAAARPEDNRSHALASLLYGVPDYMREWAERMKEQLGILLPAPRPVHRPIGARHGRVLRRDR